MGNSMFKKIKFAVPLVFALLSGAAGACC